MYTMLFLYVRERHTSDDNYSDINSVIKLEKIVISKTFFIISSYFAHSCTKNNIFHKEQHIHDFSMSSLL